MTYYDEQLHTLQAQCLRKKKLEAALAELTDQQKAMTGQVEELAQIMAEEQEDVDRLEGRSLSALFYGLVGKKEDKLTKEQREAYAARVKHDAAARELARVEDDLRRCRSELEGLQGCEDRYQDLLAEKTQAVKQLGGQVSEDILRKEERIACLESEKKELREAMDAGKAALETTDQVLSSLDSAEGWGTWDIFGGGLIADMAKHSHLDDAQSAVEQLQARLRTFKTELADVTIHADLQVNIEGFLRFADYFFDGLFVDWAVLDRIHQSQDQVKETRNQICGVLNQLQLLMDQADQEDGETRAQIEALVSSVPM